MKETGLRGQDVHTILRLYVGPPSVQTDAAISNRTIREHAKRRAFNAAGVAASPSHWPWSPPSKYAIMLQSKESKKRAL